MSFYRNQQISEAAESRTPYKSTDISLEVPMSAFTEIAPSGELCVSTRLQSGCSFLQGADLLVLAVRLVNCPLASTIPAARMSAAAPAPLSLGMTKPPPCPT